jgi:hypothetical protein
MIMNFVKGRSRILLSILLVGMVLLVPASAAPKMSLDHKYTWDSDMINVDSVHASYKGEGVYIAVLDTGLVPNWGDYFPKDRIATKLGKGFVESVNVDPKTGELVYAGFVHETTWVGSTYSTHGTHVTSTIIGYNYYAPSDIYGGFPLLPPVFVEGIAPDATIIPIKVLPTMCCQVMQKERNWFSAQIKLWQLASSTLPNSRFKVTVQWLSQ